MELKGKTAAVLVEQQYQEMEVWYPYYRLKEAGASVMFVGPEAATTYASKLGYPAKSDAAAKNVMSSMIDAVIVPGGFCPDYLRRDKGTINFVKEAFGKGKVIAAICHGPWLLCSTGTLKGKKATCFHSIKDDITNAGATYVDQETVVDGNLITSRTPDDLPAFLAAIIKAIKG